MKIESIEIKHLIKLGLWETAMVQCDTNILSITTHTSLYRNIYMTWKDDHSQALQGSWVWW